jgi:uncharacterized membrane protein
MPPVSTGILVLFVVTGVEGCEESQSLSSLVALILTVFHYLHERLRLRFLAVPVISAAAVRANTPELLISLIDHMNVNEKRTQKEE